MATPGTHAIFILWLHISPGTKPTSFGGFSIMIGDTHLEYQVFLPQSVRQSVPLTIRPQPIFLSCVLPSLIPGYGAVYRNCYYILQIQTDQISQFQLKD